MPPTSPTEREKDIADVQSLIARDLAASNELASRITQLRQDIARGKPQPSKKVDLLERSNKDMTKELVLRVESIESASAGNPEAIDREMLQVLNARLAVCDLQAMRLAELRDLEFTARGSRERTYLEAEVVEGSKTVGHELEEELAIGGSSNRAVDGLECNTKEPKPYNDTSRDSFENSEEDATSEDFEEPAIDKSAWPLLYRIMSVDPDTTAAEIQPVVNG